MRCTNTWILYLTTSQIPHRWMMMIHQLDLSTSDFELKSISGKLTMLSQEKPFFIPLNRWISSKLFPIAIMLQRFKTALRMNTTNPSISSTSALITNSWIFVKMTLLQWILTLLILINFSKTLNTTNLSQFPL